jgi:hypothetical protein
MKRINDAAATVLERARLYLANLPIADQNMVVENGRLYNAAIPILFAMEYYVRNEFSQD